ncbi:MAG: hypothetical protein FWF45_05900 [Coriobacteriia bacterium]|nr:hypothetical protein [Coriobacteriia bacterium]
MAHTSDSRKKFDRKNIVPLIVVLVAIPLYIAEVAFFGYRFGIDIGTGPFAVRFGSGIEYPFGGPPTVPEGPRLSSVALLPVNASGEGTIQGMPTGAASCDESEGSFVLVLDPAPADLPAKTTLNVYFNYSTKSYSGTRLLGDPLTAMNALSGSNDADPTDVAAVRVHFHIKGGKVFANRLDLSNEFPPNFKP